MSFMPHPPDPPNIYPYLLVNIGSGVSMVKVSGPRQFERVGGTSLGGGTLWGLLSLLTGARTFDDMLRLAENGDNSTVDLLVGDIYGQAYNKIGLKSTHIASSFGKVYKMKRAAERDAEDGCNGDLKHREEAEHVEGASELPHPAAGFRSEDISRSLLYAVSNNIGQLAYLHAEKHGLPRIYFGGSDNEYTVLRHSLLVEGNQTSLLSETRGLSRVRWCIFEEAAEELGKKRKLPGSEVTVRSRSKDLKTAYTTTVQHYEQ
jgi:type II pantothenate kinase